jgi:hypothetical protein
LVQVQGVVPAGRAFHSSCLLEDKNYLIIYGGILQYEEVSNELIIYDISKRFFTPIKNNQDDNIFYYPKLFGHRMYKTYKQIIIFGGYDDFSSFRINFLI